MMSSHVKLDLNYILLRYTSDTVANQIVSRQTYKILNTLNKYKFKSRHVTFVLQICHVIPYQDFHQNVSHLITEQNFFK
jgi:ABC-type lipoprotein export system ATPase subunit